MSSLAISEATALADAAASATPALSQAQLKASLWADGKTTVYGVVMGSRVPGLRLALAQAQIGEHDCLLPGALPPSQREAAPYMVQLERESPFTHWLLFEAATGLGDWGVLATSPVSRLSLRSHFRELLRARLPDGSEIDLAWMDPEILLALLPLFDPAQLEGFLGPIETIVVPRARQWTFAQRALGASPLALRHVPVLQGG